MFDKILNTCLLDETFLQPDWFFMSTITVRSIETNLKRNIPDKLSLVSYLRIYHEVVQIVLVSF